jgi:hypothetical protein
MHILERDDKKISDCAIKFGQSKEDKNIFEDEFDELQKLAADNMACAEHAAKWAAEARKNAMQEGTQQAGVVAELTSTRRSDLAESQGQSESHESSRSSNLADPDTPGRTAQVITNLQEVDNYNELNYRFNYSDSDAQENELESEDESPAAARKPAAIAKKPPAVPNVDDDEGSSANDSEALVKKPPFVPNKRPAAVAKKKPPAVPKKKPAAIAKKPPAVLNVDDDKGSSANDGEVVVKKPPTVPNVDDDEGSSDNDDQPLVQFARKKGSVQAQGEEAKKMKSGQKRKQPGQQVPKTITKKPASKKKTHADRARTSHMAIVAKSTTSPVTRV